MEQKGMIGQRIIHILCHFWKSDFSGLLGEGQKQNKDSLAVDEPIF